MGGITSMFSAPKKPDDRALKELQKTQLAAARKSEADLQAKEDDAARVSKARIVGRRLLAYQGSETGVARDTLG